MATYAVQTSVQFSVNRAEEACNWPSYRIEEDKGNQELELESRIEAAVAKALENQLPAIVAQL